MEMQRRCEVELMSAKEAGRLVVVRQAMLELVRQHYSDFDPELAREHLQRKHGSPAAPRPCAAG